MSIEIKLLKTDEDDLIEDLQRELDAGWTIAGFSAQKSLLDVEDYRILLLREKKKIERKVAIESATVTDS